MKSYFFQKYCLIALLLLSLGYSSRAQADFVDDINAGTYTTGQQVIYEMNVGSFTADGTFAAAGKRLAELKRNGIDIIWLMPIYPRGGGINSPYAATDFTAVNPAYGTLADLKAFVADAHDMGMKVWLDWVPNHTATNATWVTTHPEYYTKDANGNMIHPNNYGDVYQLDYSNAALTQAMNNCLKFWIDEADVDGFRCDYVSSPNIPVSYWQSTIPMLKAYRPGKDITMMGEADFSDVTALQAAGFDYDYAWGFQGKLQTYGATGSYATPIITYSKDLLSKSKAMNVSRMLYLTNHDENWNYDLKTLNQKYGANKYLLTVLSYTLWGMPLLYNGQEIGGNQALNYFEDTKIDWSQPDQKMLNTVRTLAAIKHSQAALHDAAAYADNAEVSFLTTTNNNSYITAYRRTRDDSEVVVLLNTSTTAQTALISGITGTYSQWLNSDSIAQGVSRHNRIFNGSLSVSVPAKGYLVYVKGNYPEANLPTEAPIDNLVDSSDYAVYYESPIDQATVCAWIWNDTYGGETYATSGTWPGDTFQRLGKTVEGNVVYKYSFALQSGVTLPDYIIITENGSADANKVVNGAAFVNHGYYVKGQPEAVRTVTTGITNLTVSDLTRSGQTTDDNYYNLAGQRVSGSTRGILIHWGRKVLRNKI